MTAFELAGKLSLDSSGFSTALKQQESSFKQFGTKLAKKAATVGKVAMATLGAGAVMVGKASVQEGLEFDKAMSQVAATLGKTKEEIADLSKFAREMGSKTAFSATEAAEALNYMALAGYDADTSMKMLPTVLNLAAAGNIDLAKASDMVTDAQSALGLSIEGTERMVDQMAKTSSKTNTSVEQLGDAFLTVGGTAKMMGKGSIDTTTELSMALGVLADNGIKGAEGGTMLRNILLSLSAPTDKAAKKLKELGVEVFDSSGEMRDLPFILQDINEATKDMTDQERTDFLSEVFNKRDLKAIEALLGTDMSRWEELFNEIGHAEGSAEKMAETQLDNLAGDLTIFKSALSEAKLSISDKLSPTLRKFVQRATVWVGRLTNAFNEKGLSGAIKEAKTIVKELITESLGLGSDASWSDIGRAAAQKLKDGIKSGIDKAKVKLANLLGLTDENGQAVDDPSDVSWFNIAKAAVSTIKDKFVVAAGQAKVKLANLLGMTDNSGNAIDDPSDTSWTDVAKAAYDKIKEGFTTATDTAKVKLANLLGLTDASGNVVDDPSDVTWGNVAKAAFDKIKEKFTGAAGTAKVKLANWLGLTDDSGNAIDDPSDTTWGSIGSKMLEKIKTGFSGAVGKTKIKLANWLGLTDDAGNAVDDPGDTSWSGIAEKIKEKLKGGFDTLKVKLSDLLGLTPEGVGEEVDWADIGKNILDKLTSYFSHKGDFLKKLILGDEFTDKSTWTDVGKKVSGWLDEAFAEGGLINAILGNTAEKATAISEFAGNLMSGLATWISSHAGDLAVIVTNIVSAIANSIGPIAQALSAMFKDPTFQQGFSDLIVAAFNAAMDVLAGLFEMLGDVIGKAIFGEEWYEMKQKEKERVQGETGSYKEGDEDWNTRASMIDEKYNMHVVAGQDSTGAETDAMTATMMHLGITGGMPSWWSETGQLRNLVDLRKLASDAGNPYLYETATAGLRAFGEGWKNGLRQEDLTAAINEAMEAVEPPEITPEINLPDSEINKVTGIFDGLQLSIPVVFTFPNGKSIGGTSGGGGVVAGFAKGLWDVPYDDYYARLHRGETVLSASQARDYKEGNSGYGTSEIVGAIQSLKNDLANLKLVVGRKTFGRAVVNYGGSKMSDYLGGSDSRFAAGYGT